MLQEKVFKKKKKKKISTIISNSPYSMLLCDWYQYDRNNNALGLLYRFFSIWKLQKKQKRKKRKEKDSYKVLIGYFFIVSAIKRKTCLSNEKCAKHTNLDTRPSKFMSWFIKNARNALCIILDVFSALKYQQHNIHERGNIRIDQIILHFEDLHWSVR